MPTPGVIVYRYQWNGIVLDQITDKIDPSVTAASSSPAPMPVVDIGLSVNSPTNKADLDSAMAEQGWSFMKTNLSANPPVASYCLALDANFVNSTVNAANTNLSFAVSPGDVWEVEIDLTAQASAGLGILYTIAGPNNSTIEGWVESGTPAAVTGVEALILQEITAVNAQTTIPAHTGSGVVKGRDHFWFTISIPAAAPANSSVTLQVANVPGLTQNATISAGSRLIATLATTV
jgi:hypothetical protein